MKVKDLKKILESYNDDFEVVLSKDGEGNMFSPLAEVEGNSIYVPDSTWSGEIHIAELTSELVSQGFTEEDIHTWDNGIGAIVLWPTN